MIGSPHAAPDEANAYRLSAIPGGSGTTIRFHIDQVCRSYACCVVPASRSQKQLVASGQSDSLTIDTVRKSWSQDYKDATQDSDFWAIGWQSTRTYHEL